MTKLKSGGIGSPKWRKAGRPAHIEPAKPQAPTDISDLEALDEDNLRKALGREALLTIAKVMRKPQRHAQAQLGAARDLAAYTVARPAQKLDATIDSRMTGKLEIELVKSKDGREVPNT